MLFESFDDNKEVVDALKKILSCTKSGKSITSTLNGGAIMDLHDKCDDPQVQEFLVKAAEIAGEELEGTKVNLKDFFDINELEGLIRILEANPEKDEVGMKVERFSTFISESHNKRVSVSEDEMNLFSSESALQKLITDRKITLKNGEVLFDESDQETKEILDQYLEMPGKIDESVNTESYEEVSKALLDNFDDVRACSYYIEVLKKMDRWQEFLESEDGKLFKELRYSLTK